MDKQPVAHINILLNDLSSLDELQQAVEFIQRMQQANGVIVSFRGKTETRPDNAAPGVQIDGQGLELPEGDVTELSTIGFGKSELPPGATPVPLDTPAASSPAAAPASTSAPTAALDTSVVDKDGVPWDERIHSGNKKQGKNGKWMRRKNVDHLFYAQTTDALKAHVLATTGAVPGTAVPSTVIPPPPSGAKNRLVGFGPIVAHIQACIKANRLSQEQVNAFVHQVGLTQLSDLISHPDKVQAFADLLPE